MKLRLKNQRTFLRVLISDDISDYPKRSPCNHCSLQRGVFRCVRNLQYWLQRLSILWSRQQFLDPLSSRTVDTVKEDKNSHTKVKIDYDQERKKWEKQRKQGMRESE